MTFKASSKPIVDMSDKELMEEKDQLNLYLQINYYDNDETDYMYSQELDTEIKRRGL